MLDPVVSTVLSLGFGLLFLLAAAHKVMALHAFRAVLEAYDVLPAGLVAPVTRLIPLLEGLLGVAWIVSMFSMGSRACAAGSAVVLAGYTVAIGINLLRGRVHIGCGCGFGRSSSRDQPLSRALILRNSVLIVATLPAMFPGGDRPLGPVDYATVVAGLLAAVLLHMASEQLLMNHAALGTWRRTHD